MNRNIALIGAVALLLTASCQSMYKGVITLTQVRDSAMKELAQLNKQGFIDAQTDAKITVADEKYRAAARTAELALVAYKNGGSQAEYVKALEAVRAAVSGVIDLLRPLSTPGKVESLDANLRKAVVL